MAEQIVKRYITTIYFNKRNHPGNEFTAFSITEIFLKLYSNIFLSVIHKNQNSDLNVLYSLQMAYQHIGTERAAIASYDGYVEHFVETHYK